MEDFIYRAQNLWSQGLEDTALDLLYEELAKLITSKDFQLIEQVLLDIDIKNLSENIIFALIIHAYSIRDQLPNYHKFFTKTLSHFESQSDINQKWLEHYRKNFK